MRCSGRLLITAAALPSTALSPPLTLQPRPMPPPSLDRAGTARWSRSPERTSEASCRCPRPMRPRGLATVHPSPCAP
eukprot:scaffold1928_cov381-Prasinococcus_capsulatus_cf.AAC.5